MEKFAEDFLGESWRAAPTPDGSAVAVKILHANVTANPYERELIVSEAGAARKLKHPGIAELLEVGQQNDRTYLVYALPEGTPLADVIVGRPLDRERLFSLAVQLAEALGSAHQQNLIHGALSAAEIFINPHQRAIIGGFGPGRGSAFRGTELEEPSQAFYFSPESILHLPLDPRSDIFSLGSVFYEMATGKPPFDGGTPAEICNRIARSAPSNPRALNASLDAELVRILGRCLQKDPATRYRNAAELLTDLQRLAPAAAARPELDLRSGSGASRDSFSGAQSRTDTTGEAAPSENIGAPDGGVEEAPGSTIDVVPMTSGAAAHSVAGERTILYASLSAPAMASELEEKRKSMLMQIVSEASYLFDGRIVDPLSSVVVAEFESARQATRAARTAKEELLSHDREQRDIAGRLMVRLVLARISDSAEEERTFHEAVDLAIQVAAEIPPASIAVEDTVLSSATLPIPADPLTTLGSARFFALPDEPALPLPAADEAPSAGPGTALKRKNVAILSVAGLVVLLTLGSIAWYVATLDRRLDEEQRRALAAASSTPVPEVASEAAPLQVVIDPFSMGEAPEPVKKVVEGARFALIGILNASPRVVASTTMNGEAIHFGGKLIEAGPPAASDSTSTEATPDAATSTAAIPPPAVFELTPLEIRGIDVTEGPRIVADDLGSLTSALTQWVGGKLRVDLPPPVASNTVLENLGDAIRFRQADGGKTDRAIAAVERSVNADSSFLPAQLLALDLYRQAGDRHSAAVAAEAILKLDPGNLPVMHSLARWKIGEGEVGVALQLFRRILANRPDNTDALQAIGLYSLSAGDEAAFRRALDRLQRVRVGPAVLHAPDVLLYSGKIDDAASPYFELESQEPSNPSVAFNVGRIAVLRRMMSIADIETKKLQKLDPEFGYPMMTAYVFAQSGNRSRAEESLEKARATASWQDLPWTYSAEVYAIVGDVDGVLSSLQEAVNHGEPSGAYILNDPLFRFLSRDPRFAMIREAIVRQQAEIRTVLAGALP